MGTSRGGFKYLRLNFYRYMERSGVMEDVYIVRYHVCVQ